MLKSIKGFAIFIFLLGILAISEVYGYFEIDKYDINCKVLENGNMKVDEILTYRTNETRNGVYRDINTSNSANSKNSATGMKLVSVSVDDKLCTKVASGKNGQSNVYEYNSKSNKIKVYVPFNNNGHVIKYEYILENVAVKYTDIAEIYWNFVGKQWEDKINKLNINIELPDVAKKDTIYVYGHGSDTGTFKKNLNKITLNVTNIYPGNAIDARILFSKDALTGNSKNVNKEVLNNYINKEEGINNEGEYYDTVINTLPNSIAIPSIVINIISIIFSIVIICIWIYIYFKYAKEDKVTKYKYYREIPSGYPPEILQSIYYNKENSHTVWITFLGLIRKNVYKIEKYENKKNKKAYKVMYQESNQKLEPHEKYLVSWLNEYFEEDNGMLSIDLKTLKSSLSKDQYAYRSFEDFQKKVKQKRNKLFNEKLKLPKKVITTTMILMGIVIAIIFVMTFLTYGIGAMLHTVLIMTTIIYTMVFKHISMDKILVILFMTSIFQFANFMMLESLGLQAMFVPYLLLFIMLQYVIIFTKYTPEQRDLIEKLKGLKRYLSDFSLLNEKEIEYVSLWEDFFIMAVALKVNSKSINYFYMHLEDNIGTSNLGNSMLSSKNYNTFSSTFSRTFNTFGRPASSGGFSGGSGGFSGGSGSGGGGRWPEAVEAPSKLKVTIINNNVKIAFNTYGFA